MEARADLLVELTVDEMTFFTTSFESTCAMIANARKETNRLLASIDHDSHWVCSINEAWFQNAIDRTTQATRDHKDLVFIDHPSVDIQKDTYVNLTEYPAEFFSTANLKKLKDSFSKSNPIMGLVFDAQEATKFNAEQFKLLAAVVANSRIIKLIGVEKLPLEVTEEINKNLTVREGNKAIPSLQATHSVRFIAGQRKSYEEKQEERVLQTGPRP